MSSLAAVARAEWDAERYRARLARMLGKDEAIEGVVSWKHEEKAQSTFDSKRFDEEHPELVTEHTKPESYILSVDIHFLHRPYPLGG